MKIFRVHNELTRRNIEDLLSLLYLLFFFFTILAVASSNWFALAAVCYLPAIAFTTRHKQLLRKRAEMTSAALKIRELNCKYGLEIAEPKL